MTPQVIASKLFVPTLKHGFVPRPRIGGLLHQGAESRLTLLSAPAGFGKTTLPTQWLHQTAGEDRRVAWLPLESSDSDPGVFFTCVVAALQAVVPSLAGRRLTNWRLRPCKWSEYSPPC